MSTEAAIDRPLYAHDSFRTPIGLRGMDDARDCAYADFVRERSHALLRSAFLLTGDQHLAEDLVQEALARTHRAWSRLERPSNAGVAPGLIPGGATEIFVRRSQLEDAQALLASDVA